MSSSNMTTQIATMKRFFQSGASRSIEWRRNQLEQLAKMTKCHQTEIINALQLDLSKSEQESWATEIGFVLGDIKHTLSHLKKWSKPRKVSTPIVAQPGASYLLPEPKGVVLIIGAWNYPFQLLLAPFIATIAAGNCAVLKPSELAVNTSALLAKLIPEYLDNQAFCVIEGGVTETTELLQLQFEHILYTGGEQVGKIVMRAAAEHLTPVTLELGGKSPCIVDSATNLAVTAKRIVWSKWMNAGQTCVAPDYILVEKEFAPKLIDEIRSTLQEFYGDDPKASKDYGRIINQRHHQRLSSYLDGQEVVHGGQTDTDNLYIAPTLLLNPKLDSPVMSDEIFGPILPVVTVDNLNTVTEFINQRAKPLALYVFSKNQKWIDELLSNTSAGSVCVNDGMMFMTNPELPFGGVGNSGMGSYHGRFGFDTFSHLKAVMKRSFLFDVALRYPPFSHAKLTWLKRLL